MENKSKIILANWKMQLSYQESIELANSIIKYIRKIELKNIDIALLPDFLSIAEISKILKDNQIKLGSQDIFWEDKGSFTGEVSPKNLKYLNCEYVVIGHSERRQYLKESDEMINKKLKQIVKNSLIPILCVGENFEQRRDDQKDFVVMEQVRSALLGLSLSNIKQLIIAYEPVWVIGSGQAIEPDEAEHTNLVIKEAVLESFVASGINIDRNQIDEKVKFIYGGSVDKNNVSDFISRENIDGVLVGGASLKLESFLDIINIVNKISR